MSEPESMGPEEILKALDQQWTTYPRELIQAAMDRREEVAPHLLAYLRNLVREVDCPPVEVLGSILPAFCFHLLSYFREGEAHQLFIDLATAGSETTDWLFGDLLTEDLAVFLWMTSGGNDDAIRKLIACDDVSPVVRSEALVALTYGIAEGVLERDEVVQFIQPFFEEEPATEDNFIFLATAVECLRDLHPGESMEIIRSAFANDIIDSFWVSLEEIEATSMRPQEDVVSCFLEAGRTRMAMEPHERMSWWACFRTQKPASQRSGLSQTQRKEQRLGLAQTERNKKKANRKKRKIKHKISKASKKK